MIENIPWWVKILVGIGGIAVLYFLFDLANYLIGFLMFVTIPLSFFYFIGLIGEGTYEAYASGEWLEDLRSRVDGYRETLRQQEALSAETD